nr:hypothetical protein [Tanacetum cinerariifolium]
MRKIKIKTPSLDQTVGRKEGSLARKLSHKKIQGQRKESHQAPLKIPPVLIISHLASNNDEQPDDKTAPKNDRFKKPERPSTPDLDWNKRRIRPSQTWISITARAEKPPTSFDELIDTPIDFSSFAMNWLNIANLTQKLLVGPAFNLLKGTYKSLTELEYHFKECSKATTERLDWHNP